MRIRRAVQKDRELIWRATMETVWQDLSEAEQREVGRAAMEEHCRATPWRRLMEHAAGWCRRQGLSTLRLEVAAGNLGARAFYAAEGFAEERLYLGRGV